MPRLTPADPPESSLRERRRALILEWARSGPIESQVQLQRDLEAAGVHANQGTLSRDLRDLGLVKSAHGWELPAAGALQSDDAGLALLAAARAWLVEALPAASLVVVRTPPGGANPLALALDHAGWADVLGTIAGDDTVFVATAGPAEARRVAAALAALTETGPR
jgi:transcriptional regulator of arginine metabolism